MIRRQLITGLLMTVALVVLAGLVYPLAVTAAAKIAFPYRANGSLVEQNGAVVGSALLARPSNGDPRQFQPRPSAASGGVSGASNLGPTNPKLVSQIAQWTAAYRAFNRLAGDAAVPPDAVTASASGFDPDISPANARLQAPRVAAARGLPLATVMKLVNSHVYGRQLGFLGEPTVNALDLNVDLDKLR